MLALFDKPDPLDGPFFEETIYVTPSRLPAEVQAAIARGGGRGRARSGLRDGPDARRAARGRAGAVRHRVAARSIGGLCSRTLRFGTGMSLEELILRHALGLADRRRSSASRGRGRHDDPDPAGGSPRASRGLDEARAVPGIEEVTISATRASGSCRCRRATRYLGFIFARAADARGAEAALREAHARLEFRIAAQTRRRIPVAAAQDRASAIAPRTRAPSVPYLRRRVVGIPSGGVVRRVEDLSDERREVADRLLDALLQRHVGRAAALASAAQAQVHVVPLDVDQLDEAAVRGDGRVDLAVEQVADGPLEVALGGQIVGSNPAATIGTPPRMCLRMMLPMPRAGQSTSCAGRDRHQLSATSTDSIPGIGSSSAASGDFAAPAGSAKCADSPGKSGRSTVNAHRSPRFRGLAGDLDLGSMAKRV